MGTPDLVYAAQWLAYAIPCQRFAAALTGYAAHELGPVPPLHLHRRGLPPPTSCRSPGAPVHTSRIVKHARTPQKLIPSTRSRNEERHSRVR